MLVFDLETNGLLNEATCIHCIAIYDTLTDQTLTYNDVGSQEPIVRGVQVLETADLIVGHNVIGFDIPVIKKIYPWFNPVGKVVDTLLLSRLYHTDMMAIDKRRNKSGMPAQLYSRHSLEAWGYRLSEYKGEFGKTTDWKEWSQEMQDYCVQDVKTTTRLCTHFVLYLIGSS